MKMRARKLLLAGLFSGFHAGCDAEEPETQVVQSFRLVYSNNLDGETEPCG